MANEYDFCVTGEGAAACLSALMVQARAPQSKVLLCCLPDRVFRPPYVSLSPLFQLYLRDCSINPTEFFAHGQNQRLSASRFINWGSYCQDHTQSWSEYGGAFSAVPFHELLSACSKEFETKPIDYYCLANRADSSGVTLSPERDPRSIRSTLQYGHLFNRMHLQEAIIGHLKRNGAAIVYPNFPRDEIEKREPDEIFELVHRSMGSQYSCKRNLFVYSSPQCDAQAEQSYYYVVEGGRKNDFETVDYIGGGNYWLKHSGLGGLSTLEVMAQNRSEAVQLAESYWSSQGEGRMSRVLHKPGGAVGAESYGDLSAQTGGDYFRLPLPRLPMIHFSDLDIVIQQMSELSDYLYCDPNEADVMSLWNRRLVSSMERFSRFNRLLLSLKCKETGAASETGSCMDPRNSRLINAYRQRGLLPEVDSYPLSPKEMGALLYGLLGPFCFNNPLISQTSEKPRRFLEAIDRAITKVL